MMIPHSRLIFNLILFSLLFHESEGENLSELMSRLSHKFTLSSFPTLFLFSSLFELSVSTPHNQPTSMALMMTAKYDQKKRAMLVKAQKGISNYLCRFFFFANIHNIFHLILSAQPYWLVCLINRNRINVRALRTTTIKKPAVGGNGKLYAHRSALRWGMNSRLTSNINSKHNRNVPLNFKTTHSLDWVSRVSPKNTQRGGRRVEEKKWKWFARFNCCRLTHCQLSCLCFMFLSAFAFLYLNYTTRATFTRLSSPPREYIVDVWYWEKWKENENEWNQTDDDDKPNIKISTEKHKTIRLCWGSETIGVESQPTIIKLRQLWDHYYFILTFQLFWYVELYSE